MTWWAGARARHFVLVFGTLSACSKCPPAEPVPVQIPPDANLTRVPNEPESEPIEAGSERRLVLGSGGQPIGERGRARYTSTGSECPPGPEDICEDEGCGVHDRVSCQANCDGYRSRYYMCENGSWSLRETREPACQCTPRKLPAELAACTTHYVSTRPDGLSPSNECTLGLTCAGRELWVECRGEQDGTNTSLCRCLRDRQEQRIGDLFPGEGPDAR